jgi:alpha-tubulin suppressor-like RCC1 family protein
MRHAAASFASFLLAGLVGCADALPSAAPVDVNTHDLSSARSQATLATGRTHACAVRSDGQVMCWGANDLGQLGDGTTLDRAVATPVALAQRAVSVAAGDGFSCVLEAQGGVKCFGINSRGQLGTGGFQDATAPVAVVGISNAIRISAGSAHACALLADGTARCWGAGTLGALGQGALADSTVPVPVVGNPNEPVPTAKLESIVDLDAGDDHTCAVLANGDTFCWGNFAGRASTQAGPVPIPLHLFIEPMRSISAGHGRTCASGEGGQVWCWDAATPPAEVAGETAFSLDSGAQDCLVTPSGLVRCRGANGSGEVGDGSQLPREYFVSVLGLDGALQVAAGEGFSCAQLALGGVSCWGKNDRGQLGDGSLNARAVAMPVSGLSGAWDASLSLGEWHTCAVSAGKLRCWGAGASGQLGNGLGTDSAFAVAVPSDDPLRQVAAFSSVTLALTARGKLLATGSEGMLQLFGDGVPSVTPGPTMTPKTTSLIPLPYFDKVVRLSAGSGYGCVLKATGDVSCWGDNRAPAFKEGVFTRLSSSSSSLYVAAWPTYTGLTSPLNLDLATGASHLCALRSNGQVHCRGKNDKGQLGRGTFNGALPSYEGTAEVKNLGDAIDVAAGGDHTCAVRSNGRVMCWGSNSKGQLGDGSAQRSLPSQVGALLPRAQSLALGREHTCALTSEGSVFCWGANEAGQLGNGSTTDSPVPVQVSALNDVVALDAGPANTCATRATGAVYCWGANAQGQLGDGSKVNRLVPKAVSSGKLPPKGGDRGGIDIGKGVTFRDLTLP